MTLFANYRDSKRFPAKMMLKNKEFTIFYKLRKRRSLIEVFLQAGKILKQSDELHRIISILIAFQSF